MPDPNRTRDIKEFEEKLLGLRNILITDLSKREKFVLNLSDLINTHKDEYFSYEDSKNKNNKGIKESNKKIN